jgi:4-hydroxybenzoate polyprenyltransferase
MKKLNLFIELIILKNPIGFMLLFWPCAWGLTLAYDFSNNLNDYFFYLSLFFLGSILMRSAGCIVNDILDKEFDTKVLRTKNRPLASGKISIKIALTYVVILCFLALLVLLQFNNLTVLLALGSMPLAFSYPLMKRYTYWPQFFLGITFNYGLVLGWICIKNEIDIIAIIFYLGAIFWTIGFDTIYGYQDIKDDEIIGIKSTSIKFKKNPRLFLTLCYSIFAVSLIVIGIHMNFNTIFYLFLIIPIMHLFFYQIYNFNYKDPKNSLKIFKSNNLVGLIILCNILIGKNLGF